MSKVHALLAVFGLMVAVPACDGGGDGSGGGGGGGGSGGSGGGAASDPQLPPTSSAADINAWLAEGHYKDWACESAEHEARPPSPHGFNRICSNAALSGHTGTGEYPVGSAGVKELWDAMGGKIVGYATYRHTQAGTGGDSWFWYEIVPLDHPAPHDAAGVVAFGAGDAGPAKDICVGCHAGAGSDADHSGHDMVYTQVQ